MLMARALMQERMSEPNLSLPSLQEACVSTMMRRDSPERCLPQSCELDKTRHDVVEMLQSYDRQGAGAGETQSYLLRT